MKTLLALSVIMLVALDLRSANPAFTDFNINQFDTTGKKVTIKSGALITNLFSEWVANVKNAPYNAVGDGITDDTVAISNALARTAVYFPPGTYLTSTMYPTNQTIIFGDSAQTAKLVLKEPDSNSLIFCSSNFVSIRDLWLDGGTNLDFTTSVPPNATVGLQHWCLGETMISGLRVTGFRYGIFITGPINGLRSENANYYANAITNCYAGFYFNSANTAEYIVCEGNLINSCYYAIRNASAANVTVVGNRIVDCTFGFAVLPTSTFRAHSLYTCNTVNHCTYTISSTSAGSATFVGNHFLAGATISLTDCTNFFLADNQFEQQTFAFSGGRTNIISNNRFSGVPALTGATSDNVKFSHNFALGTPKWSGTFGTATVPNGSTSIAVTHNLGVTPDISDILVTPQNNLGAATKFWVSAVSSTTFTITVDANPGATTAIFSWRHID